MSKEATLNIEENERYFIFHVAGKFVGDEETEILKNELEKRAKVKNNRVILDFAEVTYFSSLALGILVKEDENFSMKDGKLIICNIPSFLENIFTMTKLNNILNLIRTLDEAERSILI